MAYKAASSDALETLAEPVPLVIRNAPTTLMKDLNYGKSYKYAHDYDEKLTDMQCLPDKLASRVYYHPTTQGSEARAKDRLESIDQWKRERRTNSEE
jgi:putative ATPase